jgi:exosortase B
MTAAATFTRSGIWEQAKRFPVLTLALIVTVLPTLYSMATESWTREEGVHGPLVLATAIWLVWRSWDEIVAEARPGKMAIAVPVLVLASAAYVMGRAFNLLLIEVAALLLGLLAIAYAFAGHRVLMKMWFPIFYLGFLIPIPGYILDTVTQPLKYLVSDLTTAILAFFGYPITQVGVTIYIAQYQLLVEDACAGLNSLISLTAVGLFYIYLLHNASWRYSLLLLAFVLPIAIAANVVRVILLVLLTYYFGNEVAQGYLHDFAGIVTFVSALLFIFLLDSALTPVRRWLGRKSDAEAA